MIDGEIMRDYEIIPSNWILIGLNMLQAELITWRLNIVERNFLVTNAKEKNTLLKNLFPFLCHSKLQRILKFSSSEIRLSL